MEFLDDPEEFIEDEEYFDGDELDEDFEDKDFDEDMDDDCKKSSCSKPKKVSVTSLAGLKKHFDDVDLERTDVCNVLTLRDKANRTNYDWVVWLQVKIPFKGHNSHAGHSDDEYTEGICKDILEWVDLLKNFEKSSNKQLSLFDDGTDDELEPEPESPKDENAGDWNKYHRKLEEVRKNNLKKRYTFFELCNDANSWYAYHDPKVVKSWINQLPKSNAEMIELVKVAIVKGTTSEEGHGRFEQFWWDDSTGYMTRDGALSDYELLDRVKHLIRLYLVPYTRYFHVDTDLSYSAWEFETKMVYRFYFNGREIESLTWLKSDDLPKYELYDEAFIAWLRDYFKIPYKDVISDDDILRNNLIDLFGRAYRDVAFNVLDEIKKAKNFGEFKTKAMSCAKLGNGGGSGYSVDGFRGSYNLFQGKKGYVLSIRQSILQRLQLNRSIEGMEVDTYDNKSVYVYKLTFAEALEKAYELFGPQKPKQLDLFDFLAA